MIIARSIKGDYQLLPAVMRVKDDLVAYAAGKPRSFQMANWPATTTRRYVEKRSLYGELAMLGGAQRILVLEHFIVLQQTT